MPIYIFNVNFLETFPLAKILCLRSSPRFVVAKIIQGQDIPVLNECLVIYGFN